MKVPRPAGAATARVKWSKEVNKVVIECYLRSRPVNENGVPIRGYRQGMFRVWQEIGLFEATEQRTCDQARAIRKNGWLPELEIEMEKKKRRLARKMPRMWEIPIEMKAWKVMETHRKRRN